MPPVCPYCSSPAELVDSARVYGGRSYGPVWCCPNYPSCDSYVGCHKGTESPLGRMADAELRRWKKAAHAAFDKRWASVRSSTKPKPKRRNLAYAWLAIELGIPAEACHIGMFDVAMCERVVEVCMVAAETF